MSDFKLEVGAYEAPRKPNPFDAVVEAVSNTAVDPGQYPSGTVTIPVETALSTAQAKIREAARTAGVKARIRNVDEENRKITFTLHDKKTSEADEVAEDEAPE
jgi:hypothetical protein